MTSELESLDVTNPSLSSVTIARPEKCGDARSCIVRREVRRDVAVEEARVATLSPVIPIRLVVMVPANEGEEEEEKVEREATVAREAVVRVRVAPAHVVTHWPVIRIRLAVTEQVKEFEEVEANVAREAVVPVLVRVVRVRVATHWPVIRIRLAVKEQVKEFEEVAANVAREAVVRVRVAPVRVVTHWPVIRIRLAVTEQAKEVERDVARELGVTAPARHRVPPGGLRSDRNLERQVHVLRRLQFADPRIPRTLARGRALRRGVVGPERNRPLTAGREVKLANLREARGMWMICDGDSSSGPSSSGPSSSGPLEATPRPVPRVNVHR
jgi:hypothetical protein